jgi:polyferredoxin
MTKILLKVALYPITLNLTPSLYKDNAFDQSYMRVGSIYVSSVLGNCSDIKILFVLLSTTMGYLFYFTRRKAVYPGQNHGPAESH